MPIKWSPEDANRRKELEDKLKFYETQRNRILKEKKLYNLRIIETKRELAKIQNKFEESIKPKERK